MALVILPFIFSSGTTIVASQTNSNNTVFINAINGGLDNTNLNGSAGITYANLNLNANDIPVSKVNLGSAHQGDVFVDTGSGITRLIPGAAGQFLQTQGAGANAQWASVRSFVPNNIQVFTINGTWTQPTGILNVYVKVIGGGGGTNANNSAAGSGGYTEGVVAVTGNVTITVGLGGNSGGSVPNGGVSSFAGTTTLSANGGTGVASGSSAVGVGATATSTSGALNIAGNPGVSSPAYIGGNTPMGFGQGSIGDTGVPTGYGAGGSGGSNNGAGGIVIVYY